MATWFFSQRSGRATDKTLYLDGSLAPYGRPRQGAVVKELIRINVQTTNYPGSKAPPTRHVFGSWWEPTELHGRWMTRYISSGQTANQVADEWTAFVRDELPLAVGWGNIVSYEGMISELELARESEHEIAWRMVVLLDRRTDVISTPNTRRPESLVNSDTLGLYTLVRDIANPPVLPELSVDIFTYLDNVAGVLKGYTAQLVDFANLADSIEKQAFSTVQSFRGVLANIETALTQVQLVVANGVTDAVLLVRRTESDVRWYQYLLDTDVACTSALALINDISRKLDASQTSSDAGKFITAQDKDTWETLATRALGSPDYAGRLRESNGIKYGQLPIAGETYLVP